MVARLCLYRLYLWRDGPPLRGRIPGRGLSRRVTDLRRNKMKSKKSTKEDVQPSLQSSLSSRALLYSLLAIE